MAEERVEGREITWQRLMPWTMLFRTFQVTLDLNKLLLAAGGILVTAFVWAFLALVFRQFVESDQPPLWPGNYASDEWQKFRKARQNWNLMHEATDLSRRDAPPARFEILDLAETPEEFALFEDVQTDMAAALARLAELEKKGRLKADKVIRYRALLGQVKPAGRLAASPWSEDRGPNPYLLLTGQSGIPWEPGHFWDWFSRDQLPVMLEPLVKLVRPVIYFLSPRNDFTSRLYFFLVTVSTVLIWSFFGGAITRIAAVQLTRGERIGMIEAIRFTSRRLLSHIIAPMVPLGVVAGLVIILGIFGFLSAITYLVGDLLLGGLLWIIPLALGLIMAMALVGLVGWPLMAAAISTEGTDSWEAVTRAYGYVYQRPWHCIWYAILSLLYGGLVVFFVGFMGSLTVYLAKWGVSQAPFIERLDREPNYLFVYAPTSFGWRELLLEGTVVKATEKQQGTDELLKRYHGHEVVLSRASRMPSEPGMSRWNRVDQDAYKAYLKTLAPWNTIGAALTAFWLGLAFLLVLGFGYVFFWTASTIIYLLLRKSLEAAELDEVYMEEEDYTSSYTMPAPPSPTPAPVPAPAPARAATLPMVEPPKAVPAPAPAPAPAPPPPPANEPPPATGSGGTTPPIV